MTLEDAAERVIDGSAILFLGAGFSKGATNRRKNDFKLATEFAEHLARLADQPPESPLQDAAEAFRIKFGATALFEEILQEYTAIKAAPFQSVIASFPWRRVYTTNYDNVYELASADAGRAIATYQTDKTPISFPADASACIHLNGYVLGARPDSLDSTLKLTDSSYLSSSIADSAWGLKFREDSRHAGCLIFVGYGMGDLDVARLFVASHPKLSEKTFFFIGDSKSQVLKNRLSRFGTVVPENGAQFAERLTGTAKNYTPKVKKATTYTSISKRSIATSASAPNDQAFLDLFELGLVDDSAIKSSLLENKTYFLERTKTKQVLDAIEKTSPVIAITSALGNGKTLFLEGLVYRASEAGYSIYFTNALTVAATLEFEQLARTTDKFILIVDNYPKWLDAIRAFRQVRNNNAKLIVAARRSHHDVLIEKLEDVCGVASVPEFQIDKLDQSELTWFSNALDEYGLWKSAAGKSKAHKLKILSENYHGEIHAILLGLLQSRDIGTRVEHLLRSCRDNPRYFEVIASVFVLATIGTPSTIDTLSDLWGVELISSGAFRSHESVRQLLDFSSWSVRARSSVVSAFTLRQTIGSELIPLLIKLATHASRAAHSSPLHFELVRELQKYSNLQRMLPEEGRRAACIQYYESIKQLPQSQRNPLFWLQYAIACFIEGDLKRARSYFETSYSIAHERKFNTYQIDNHYARFLLLEAANQDLSIEKAIEKFRKARQIINVQLNEERQENPYSAATGYQNFIDKYGTQLSESMCSEMRTAAEQVLSRAKDLPPHVRDGAVLGRCVTAMDYILTRCDQLRKAYETLHAVPGKKLLSPKLPPPLPPRA